MKLLVELLQVIEEGKKKKPAASKSMRQKVYHADYLKTKKKPYRKYDPRNRSTHVNEGAGPKLPTQFRNGDEFFNFVHHNWNNTNTYVEHQGGGTWFASIGGDPAITHALYDERSQNVSWLDEDENEVA